MSRYWLALTLGLLMSCGSDPLPETGSEDAPKTITRSAGEARVPESSTPPTTGKAEPAYVRLLDLLEFATIDSPLSGDSPQEWREVSVWSLDAESLDLPEGPDDETIPRWSWSTAEEGPARLRADAGATPLTIELPDVVSRAGSLTLRARGRWTGVISPLRVEATPNGQPKHGEPQPETSTRILPQPGGDHLVEVFVPDGLTVSSLELSLPDDAARVSWERIELYRRELESSSLLPRVRSMYGLDDLVVPPSFRDHVKRVPAAVAQGARLEERHSLFLPSPTSVTWPLTVAWPAHLELALGFLPSAHQNSTDGVRFEVEFVARGGETTRLFERYLNPRRSREARTWTPVSIDLRRFEGQSGRLVIRTDGSENRYGPQDHRSDLAVIANPALVPIERPQDAQRPNIVLIGVDTLRADHLSAFGYERPTSPHLEALAAEGIRFHRALSPAPWTLPSFTSALTSLYPSRHGAGRGGRGGWTRVHPDAVFLSEILYGEGYRTVGMVANHLISPKYGLEQGYEIYAHPYRGGFESVAVEVPRIEEFLSRNGTAPFFLFWHIMDPHLPYDVPADIAARFLDPDYEGRFRKEVSFNYLVRRPGRRRYAHEGHPEIPSELTDADRRRIVDFYDAEVAEVDQAIGAVVASLKKNGLWENTIVAVLADHGEGLADHDHYHHGYTLYEDQIRVPLIVRFPDGPRGEVHEAPVSTIDLVPTILARLGIEGPDDWQGVDRLDPARRDHPVFSEYATYDSSALKTVYLEGGKYLHDPVFGKSALLRPAVDPAEKVDWANEDAALVARARAALDQFRRESLYSGRYHLRVRGEEGAVVRGRLRCSEVFDANAVWLASDPSSGIDFDLDRSELAFETRLSGGRAELIFWFRGDALTVEVSIDDKPISPGRIRLAGSRETLSEEGRVSRNGIPDREAASLGWPDRGSAWLWNESSGLRSLPTVDTPEDLARLRALGYVR